MKKEKRLKKFNISNKLAYALMVILSIALLGIGVYANSVGTKPNPGHLLSELSPNSPCSSGQVLTWNGNNIVCSTPTATDSRFRITSKGLCYDAPGTCSLVVKSCGNVKSLTYSYSGCGSSSSSEMDNFCDLRCSGQGLACRGDTTSSCSGGTNVGYTGTATSCSSQINTIYCFCSPTPSSYKEESYTPAGERCI